MKFSAAAACLMFVSILIPVCLPASLEVPGPEQKQPVALVGGTVHPVSGPVIARGTVLFEKGKITAVGAEIKVPADAAVVDIKGLHVYPGLIEPFTSLGLIEIGSLRATIDDRELGKINPEARVEKALNPDSERLPVTRANGVALAAVLPSGGLISGLGAVVQLDGWTAEQMTVKAPLCLLVNWPDMSPPGRELDKEAREKRIKQLKEDLEALEQAFKDARAYRQARAAEAAGGVPAHNFDIRWEAMLPVLSGEVPVWVAASRRMEIEAAVDWAKREGLKMVLAGGAEAAECADLLRENHIPVVLAPVLSLPLRRDSEYDEPYTLPDKLFRAGVEFCIGGMAAMNGNERNLPYQAAMAAAFGLPKEEALKAITLYAAQILGIVDRAGSLEVGKEATLIVTDGDPLEITTQVEKLYIQGRPVDLDTRQRALYRKYREKYRRLGEGE